jgi:hypothetical protein
MDDGRVRVGGGSGSTTQEPGLWIATAQLYDPGAGSWTATGTPFGAYGNDMMQLPDGKVLAVVPVMVGDATVGTSVELYDPITGSSIAAGKGKERRPTPATAPCITAGT